MDHINFRNLWLFRGCIDWKLNFLEFRLCIAILNWVWLCHLLEIRFVMVQVLHDIKHLIDGFFATHTKSVRLIVWYFFQVRHPCSLVGSVRIPHSCTPSQLRRNLQVYSRKLSRFKHVILNWSIYSTKMRSNLLGFYEFPYYVRVLLWRHRASWWEHATFFWLDWNLHMNARFLLWSCLLSLFDFEPKCLCSRTVPHESSFGSS